MQPYLKELPSSNLNSPEEIEKFPPKKKAMEKRDAHDSAPSVGPVL